VQIENIIKATADPIADASSYPGQLGAGRLNAFCAVLGMRPPDITGQYLICYNGGPYTFSASNWDSTYSWEISNNLTKSGSGSSITISGNNGGRGWVSVKKGSVELTKKYVYVGGPLYTDFKVEITPLQTGNVYHGYITWLYKDPYPSGQSPIDRYEWSYSDPDWSTQELKPAGPYPMSKVKIIPPWYFSPGNGVGTYAYIVGYNSCNYGSIYVAGPIGSRGLSGFVKIFPNPADIILNVEIDAEAYAHAISNEQSITEGQRLKTELSFEVRLYDSLGNLLQQQKTTGGTVQFNVSNLPDGFYYVHIYDGVSNTPTKQQIVVQH